MASYGPPISSHFLRRIGSHNAYQMIPGHEWVDHPGGALRYRRGLHLRYKEEGVFFKTSACPRFCKRRVLFCTQVRSMGVKIPLQSTKYMRL